LVAFDSTLALHAHGSALFCIAFVWIAAAFVPFYLRVPLLVDVPALYTTVALLRVTVDARAALLPAVGSTPGSARFARWLPVTLRLCFSPTTRSFTCYRYVDLLVYALPHLPVRIVPLLPAFPLTVCTALTTYLPDLLITLPFTFTWITHVLPHTLRLPHRLLPRSPVAPGLPHPFCVSTVTLPYYRLRATLHTLLPRFAAVSFVCTFTVCDMTAYVDDVYVTCRAVTTPAYVCIPLTDRSVYGCYLPVVHTTLPRFVALLPATLLHFPADSTVTGRASTLRCRYRVAFATYAFAALRYRYCLHHARVVVDSSPYVLPHVYAVGYTYSYCTYRFWIVLPALTRYPAYRGCVRGFIRLLVTYGLRYRVGWILPVYYCLPPLRLPHYLLFTPTTCAPAILPRLFCGLRFCSAVYRLVYSPVTFALRYRRYTFPVIFRCRYAVAVTPILRFAVRDLLIAVRCAFVLRYRTHVHFNVAYVVVFTAIYVGLPRCYAYVLTCVSVTVLLPFTFYHLERRLPRAALPPRCLPRCDARYRTTLPFVTLRAVVPLRSFMPFRSLFAFTRYWIVTRYAVTVLISGLRSAVLLDYRIPLPSLLPIRYRLPSRSLFAATAFTFVLPLLRLFTTYDILLRTPAVWFSGYGLTVRACVLPFTLLRLPLLPPDGVYTGCYLVTAV